MRPILALVTSSHTNVLQTTSLNQTNQQHISTNTDTYLSSDPPTLNTTSTDKPTQQDQSPIIDVTNGIVPTISVLVHSSHKPTITSNIQDCFDTTNPTRTF